MSAVDEDVPLVEDVGDDLPCHPRLPGEDLAVHGINGDVVLVGPDGERICALRDGVVWVGTCDSA